MITSHQIVARRSDSNSKTVAKYDTGRLLRSEAREDGSKLYVGVVSHADSILKYRDKKGNVRKELCLSEDLFDSASTNTLRLVPYCSPHPKYGLRVKKQDRRGYTGSRIGANESGTHLAVDFVIEDAKIQKRTDSGELAGLSAGYKCWHQPVTGQTILDGLRRCIDEQGGGIYGSVDSAREVLTRLDSQIHSGEVIYLQRDRRYYHLAGVTVPRATDALPIDNFRLDSGEVVEGTTIFVPSNYPTPGTATPHQDEGNQMTTVQIRFDGRTVEVENTDAKFFEDASQEIVQLRADKASLVSEREDMEEKMQDMGEESVTYTAKDGNTYTANMSKDGKKLYDMMQKDMGMAMEKADAADAKLAEMQDAADKQGMQTLRSTVSRLTGIKMDALTQMDSAKDIKLAAIAVHQRLDESQLQGIADLPEERIDGMFDMCLLTATQGAQTKRADAAFSRQKGIMNAVQTAAVNPSRQDGSGFPHQGAQTDGKKGKHTIGMKPMRMTAGDVS